MKRFRLHVDCSRSGIVIGGYSAPSAGMQVIHATDDDGRPIIPATALRGALRMALESLLRATGRPACARGTGIDPASKDKVAGHAPAQCALGPGGSPCAACDLFGSVGPGIEQTRRTFAALILGPAVLDADELPPEELLRPSVAITRRQRSAENERLFNRLGPAPGQSLIFKAEGRLLPVETDWNAALEQTEQRWKYLHAAARATTHIGSNRSRGLGRVEITIDPLDDAGSPNVSANSEASDPAPNGDVRLRIRLMSPTAIGGPMPRDNQRDTRFDIPGSALRGAVGFTLAETLENPNDPAFQSLVAEKDGAIFDFLYPVDDDSERGFRVAAPWPRTARTCKYEAFGGRGRPWHGVCDALLDYIAIEVALRAGRRIDQGLVERCAHLNSAGSPCGAPLEPMEGMRHASRAPRIRLVTRVSLERREDSAVDGALFTQALLEPGQWFEGSIRAIPAAGREHLLRALQSLPLSLGRGRFRGWGQICVERTESAPAAPSIEDRAAAFDEALAMRLGALGLDAAVIPRGRLIAVTLLSPLLIEERKSAQDALDDGRRAIAEALGEVASELHWLHVSRRFGFERGWSQRAADGARAGARTAYRSVLAGSVFVADMDQSDRRARALDALKRLESEGVGLRTRLGFGRVLAFDPFIASHYPRSTSKAQSGPAARERTPA